MNVIPFSPKPGTQLRVRFDAPSLLIIAGAQSLGLSGPGVIEALGHAFPWKDSPQGFDYWREIRQRAHEGKPLNLDADAQAWIAFAYLKASLADVAKDIDEVS